MTGTDSFPEPIDVDWENQYRIISSKFPPIDFFEGLADPKLMNEVFAIEALTNDRLRDEAGDITLVRTADRVSGPGSTPVMAAFTHVGFESRFSDGSFGVYYAAETMETAVAETKYHRELFLRYTSEDPGEVDMRVYIGQVEQPLHDICSSDYDYLHDPDNWNPSQAFGLEMKAVNSWGLFYRSVRNPGGLCIAALRPPAVSFPVQGPHLAYIWNGKDITEVIEKKSFSF